MATPNPERQIHRACGDILGSARWPTPLTLPGGGRLCHYRGTEAVAGSRVAEAA